VALNIGVGIQTGSGNGSQNFEAMIVSDLEFLGLRKHQGYEHRQPIEVESEVVVAPDLSGALVKADCPAGKIISASQAEANEKRVDKADKRINELAVVTVMLSVERRPRSAERSCLMLSVNSDRRRRR
jgi:hypothetical protein